LTVIYTAQSAVPETKTRGVLLPLLVILFLVSYGILTLLVVEQGRTIEAQRSLLREMLKDSTQLASLKDKLARDVAAQSHDKPAARPDQKEAVSGSSPSVVPKPPLRKQDGPVSRRALRKKLPRDRPRTCRMCGGSRG